MLGQIEPDPPVRPPNRARGFLACSNFGSANMRFAAFNSSNVMGSGFAPKMAPNKSMVYKNFDTINACSGIKSQALYSDAGSYQL